MWCWRRLLRVPWTAWRSNQSILKEISPGYSLEWLMLRLKLQILATWCEELTHCIRPWFWERLKMGGKWDDRGWNVWIASPVGWAWVWVSSWRWWWTVKPGILQSMGALRVGVDWATQQNLSLPTYHGASLFILLCITWPIMYTTWRQSFLSFLFTVVFTVHIIVCGTWMASIMNEWMLVSLSFMFNFLFSVFNPLKYAHRK